MAAFIPPALPAARGAERDSSTSVSAVCGSSRPSRSSTALARRPRSSLKREFFGDQSKFGTYERSKPRRALPTQASGASSSPSSAAEQQFVFDPNDTPAGGFFQMAREVSSLPEVFERCAEMYGTAPAITDPHREEAAKLNYKELNELITRFASGLSAMGVKAGDKVALFAENSARWLVADQGTMRAGAVNAVRGATAPIDELEYIYEHSESTGLIIENEAALGRLAPLLAAAPRQPAFVVVLWGKPQGPLPGLGNTPVLSYDELLARGYAAPFAAPKLRESDVATLIYTSGTTGKPKGVQLTQGNILSQVRYIISIKTVSPGDRTLALLPTWHVYERTAEYYFLSRGCHMIYTNISKFRDDLVEYKPQYFAAVPRVLERFYQTVEQKIKRNPKAQKLFAFFFRFSLMFVQARRTWTALVMAHRLPSLFERLSALVRMLLLWPLHAVADALVYKKIREGLGGEFRMAICGGGALAAFLDDFYEVVGVPILIGYGLTETAPTLTARREVANVAYSAGLPVPGTQVRVVDPETLAPVEAGATGLVVARGPQVMAGYYKDPEATAKVLDADGWFNTGDRGWVTPGGHLVITGRYKDIIVLSNGENIEPAAVEDVLIRSELIDQVVLVGQDQKSLGALVVPNLDALRRWARGSGGGASSSGHAREDVKAVVQSLGPNPGVTPEQVDRLFETEIAKLVRTKASFRPDEKIGAFRLVPEPFTMENGLMTQTLKIKRNEVYDRYEALIREMYE